MNRLDGKVAIVTGGARGQGEAEVRMFVAEGARVVFGDVLDDLGEIVAKDLGDAAVYLHHDVRREDEWTRLLGEAESRFGKVDILVNNAGVLDFGTLTHETSLDAYMRLVEINQVGPFLGMKTVIPAMMRNRGGSIVNISSTNGFEGYGGTIAYTASKFAVRGMTKTAALEYGKAGIRINSIHPGGIDTPMTRGADLGEMSDEEQDAMYANFAMGRAGKPDEVARLALFLASDESSYCTGSEFIVDGGMMAGTVNPYAAPDLRLRPPAPNQRIASRSRDPAAVPIAHDGHALGGEADAVVVDPQLATCLVEYLFEVVVAVVRVVVEQDEFGHLGLVRELDGVADRRVSPADVLRVLLVQVLRVVEQHVDAAREVVATDPRRRLLGEPDAERRLVVGEVRDGPPVLLDAVADRRALVHHLGGPDRRRPDRIRGLGRVVEREPRRDVPQVAPGTAAATGTWRRARPAS